MEASANLAAFLLQKKTSQLSRLPSLRVGYLGLKQLKLATNRSSLATASQE